MGIINESEMIEMINSAESVSLIQPSYRTKYPPLGLCKIKAMIGEKARIQSLDADLYCVTSLFTYNSDKVFEAIDTILSFGKTRIKRDGDRLIPTGKIIVGGVFASLMPSVLLKRYGDSINVFAGYSKTLDRISPDLDGWPVDKNFKDYCFVFTTRGCPNRCAYCAVHRIERETWLNDNWKAHIKPDKKVVMVSDNNLSAWDKSHIKDVVETITSMKKRIVFDNGLDCKRIDDEMATILSRGKYERNGMRLAFDRIEEDGVFQNAVAKLIKAGVPKSQIMAYVLFNFNDTPEEANYRAEECKRLGIRPYPQQYTPLNTLDRSEPFIGKHWTKKLVHDFRHFWLMAGYYTKMTFSDYLDHQSHS